MLQRLRDRFVPTDGIERHIVTARLLGSPATVVDVGGITGHLAAYLDGSAVTAVNVDPNADVVIEPGSQPLPFDDGAFEAAASLDTLEHIPGRTGRRSSARCCACAQRRVVLCCPLGSPLRGDVEAADNAFYRELTGEDHPWISEHIEHGPPTLPELEALFALRRP